MDTSAIGRRDEIGAVTSVLDSVSAGAPGRIVELLGEAGIGKSTVVRAVIAAAKANGWRVWSAAPTEAEAGFPWTGLAQLLTGVRRADLDSLVEAHVSQLEAATSATRTEPVVPEQVAFGLAALLDTARDAGRPLLVVVDDVQWLDRATAGALAFALRAVPSRHAVALLAVRAGEPLPFEPVRLVDADAFVHLELGGLSLASLREVIGDATGRMLGRAELAQIQQRSGGNPLYALEIARADSDALPVSLGATIGRRVGRLPAATRQVLAAAALAARPSVGLLRRALADVDVIAAMDAAEAAGVGDVRRVAGEDLITFRHPLLASAAVDTLTTSQRRNLHAALAGVADDIVERGMHLIVTLDVTDAVLADELDRAVAEARLRGATDVALELASAGVQATPPGTDPNVALRRRFVRLELLSAAGDIEGLHRDSPAVLADIESALANTAEPSRRSALAALREEALSRAIEGINMHEGTLAGLRAAEEALRSITDPSLRFDLHHRIVRSAVFQSADEALAAVERGFGAGSEHRGIFAVLGAALATAARAYLGEPVDIDAVRPRIDTVDAQDRERLLFDRLLGEPSQWVDDPRTIGLLESVADRYEQAGNRILLCQTLDQLSSGLLVRGAWDRAREVALRALDLGLDADIAGYEAGLNLALMLAAAGDAAGATERLERTARPLLERGERNRLLFVQARRGQLALTLGAPDAAERLLAAEAIATEHGLRAVRTMHYRRDLVEALVAAGRFDEAGAAAARLAADAAHSQVATAVADADAAAGVVAASGGEHAVARERFAAALAVQREFGLGYEVARTLLAAGSAARRAGQRQAARQHLAEAQQLFGGMEARVWAARCGDELKRLEGRRAAAAAGELTPTERQIAGLVAEGKSNAEIATALFVSVRTIESNLTRTYRKLGVRSRTELARHLTRS